MKVRNPWGKDKFFGDWSDKSDLWTDQFRAEVDYVRNDDGVWYISAEDYHESM